MSTARPPFPGLAWRLAYREQPRRNERGAEHHLVSLDWPAEVTGAERVAVRSSLTLVQVADWFALERIDGVLVLRCGRHRAVAEERADGTAIVRMGTAR